ncbi:TonB-dependent receptor domain-containing protein [Paraburkholderia silvatlantica]|uniref:TonB-dependent receptor domain-containing protein n=2 Tax=Paraburkholderia silvatlantica TaxID=321895 RepID=UPI000D75BB8F
MMLSIDARAFRAALNNVAQPDFSTGFFVPTGAQVTRGFDFSVKGQIAPGLRVTAGYTYSDPQVPNSFSSQIARHTGNVWLYYDVQGERFHGLGGGVGVTASSRVQYVDTTGLLSPAGTTFTVPGQAQTDMTLCRPRRSANRRCHLAFRRIMRRVAGTYRDG